MKTKTWIILGIIIGIFIVGMIFYPRIKSLFSDNFEEKVKPTQTSQSQSRSALNVNAKILKHETLNDVFRTKGILIPDERVDLSFETSGKIINIFFKEGSSVKKGELLAKVNDKPLQAELKKLEAQLPLAEDRVFRQKSLLEKDAVSQEAYESVVTELDKLKADIDLVRSRIDQTELIAPFDGVIGLRFVSEGTYASPSLVIAQLTKISPMKIEFSVNEKQANEIKPGTILKFNIENDANTYQAEVYAVESKLDETTLSLKARALTPNENGKLKPGSSTNIEINLKEIKNTIIVPSISVIAELGRDIVYVYRNGKAKQVQITKGTRTSSSVQVTYGLNAYDTLITTGVMQLRDGMDVSLANIN
jgi:membrane fusion protein (multidrug efflux system)